MMAWGGEPAATVIALFTSERSDLITTVVSGTWVQQEGAAPL